MFLKAPTGKGGRTAPAIKIGDAHVNTLPSDHENAHMPHSPFYPRQRLAAMKETPDHFGVQPLDDVFALGMCLLEMATLTPHSEFIGDPADVLRLSPDGVPQFVLSRLEAIGAPPPQTDFLELICTMLSPLPSSRPTVDDLLESPTVLTLVDPAPSLPPSLRECVVSVAAALDREASHEGEGDQAGGPAADEVRLRGTTVLMPEMHQIMCKQSAESLLKNGGVYYWGTTQYRAMWMIDEDLPTTDTSKERVKRTPSPKSQRASISSQQEAPPSTDHAASPTSRKSSPRGSVVSPRAAPASLPTQLPVLKASGPAPKVPLPAPPPATPPGRDVPPRESPSSSMRLSLQTLPIPEEVPQQTESPRVRPSLMGELQLSEPMSSAPIGTFNPRTSIAVAKGKQEGQPAADEGKEVKREGAGAEGGVVLRGLSDFSSQASIDGLLEEMPYREAATYVASNPTAIETFFLSAEYYRERRGRWLSSDVLYRCVLQVKPKSTLCWLGIAHNFLCRGHLMAARAAYRQAVECNKKERAVKLFGLSELFRSLEDLVKVLVKLMRAKTAGSGALSFESGGLHMMDSLEERAASVALPVGKDEGREVDRTGLSTAPAQSGGNSPVMGKNLIDSIDLSPPPNVSLDDDQEASVPAEGEEDHTGIEMPSCPADEQAASDEDLLAYVRALKSSISPPLEVAEAHRLGAPTIVTYPGHERRAMRPERSEAPSSSSGTRLSTPPDSNVAIQRVHTRNYYKQSLAVDSEDADSLCGLGEFYRLIGQTRAANGGPTDPQHTSSIANAIEWAGDLRAARSLFEQALNVDRLSAFAADRLRRLSMVASVPNAKEAEQPEGQADVLQVDNGGDKDSNA
mmetsp:Transcript_32197/g.79768  ORF Transcript_32197/g.79768 Transcript_32197/m.79768 type:complete len:856 (+) Transcript_32197:3-2570(+)